MQRIWFVLLALLSAAPLSAQGTAEDYRRAIGLRERYEGFGGQHR